MNWGFNSAANDDRTVAVSVDAMRGHALQRLAGVHQRLDGKGVGAAFSRSAKADPVGDMGFLGSLMLDMIALGHFSTFLGAHFMAHHHGMTEAFNHVTTAVGMEGVSLVTDQEVQAYRSRKGGDYPEGRRKCMLEAAKMNKKFNLLSAPQTHRFSFDAKAELACMYEILDMLDRLEETGVKMIRLDPRQPAYAALKQMKKTVFGKGAVRSYAAPVLRTV